MPARVRGATLGLRLALPRAISLGAEYRLEAANPGPGEAMAALGRRLSVETSLPLGSGGRVLAAKFLLSLGMGLLACGVTRQWVPAALIGGSSAFIGFFLFRE
jgi:hypothetical protein